MKINKFKLLDLIVSKSKFNKNRMVHYKVTKIKKSSLLVDMIRGGRKIYWTELPFSILYDYQHLRDHQQENPEHYL